MQELEQLLKAHTGSFSSVVRFNPAKDRLLAMDFTDANRALSEEVLGDTNLFSRYINEELAAASALYGIGGYGEHRTIYSRSDLFGSTDAGEEPRRLHLGTDIWGKPNTAVIAPIDGIIHSYAFNDRAGDYGATIILSHQLEGVSFFTLYGHLSLNTLKNAQEGERINKGEIFGEFGVPFENGHWPPHLHFQLITDMGGRTGDYPGVCRFSEKQIWLANSPNPDLILNLNKWLA